jgi:hypothetical protein
MGAYIHGLEEAWQITFLWVIAEKPMQVGEKA